MPIAPFYCDRLFLLLIITIENIIYILYNEIYKTYVQT